MISKNILFITVCVWGVSLTATEENPERSWWWPESPITSMAKTTNKWLLDPLAQANAGTQFAVALGALASWSIYRWFYLPSRTRWVDLIPDKIRRLFNIEVDALDVTQQEERNFYTTKFNKKVDDIGNRAATLRLPLTDLSRKLNPNPQKNGQQHPSGQQDGSPKNQVIFN